MDNIQNDLKELEVICDGINSKLNKLQDSSGNQRRILKEDLERDLDEAQKILRILNRSSRDLVGVSQAERNQLRSELSHYETELAEQWKKFSVMTTSGYSLAPDSLDDGFDMLSDQQKTKIIATNRQIESQNSRLDRAQVAAQESEEIGGAIISNLDHQRGVLLHARGNVFFFLFLSFFYCIFFFLGRCY